VGTASSAPPLLNKVDEEETAWMTREAQLIIPEEIN